jgi:uncharacterized protein
MIGIRAVLAAASVALLLAPCGAQAVAPLTTAGGVNRGVVELETLGASGASVEIGEDLANLIDDGATRRVLPIVGKGSLQNIIDLRALHGIDMAILQIDVLDYVKEQHMFPGIDHSLTYIAKLYNEEFHLLARADIKTVADLANKKVNVDIPGAGTGIIAQRLFGLLKVPATLTNDDEGTAIEKLRHGDIAAVAFVAGKPAPLFHGLDGKDGLHLLAIPLTPAITAAFVPTRLTATDYPGLVPPDQPVDTVAIGTILAAANLTPGSERYRNVVNFVDAFFTGFRTLTDPGHHPKWREVNLAAEVPGWRRFPPAAAWLQRNAPAAVAVNPQDLKTMFMRFIDERQQATGTSMTQQQKNDLFGQFEKWQSGQSR